MPRRASAGVQARASASVGKSTIAGRRGRRIFSTILSSFLFPVGPLGAPIPIGMRSGRRHAVSTVRRSGEQTSKMLPSVGTAMLSAAASVASIPAGESVQSRSL